MDISSGTNFTTKATLRVAKDFILTVSTKFVIESRGHLSHIPAAEALGILRLIDSP